MASQVAGVSALNESLLSLFTIAIFCGFLGSGAAILLLPRTFARDAAGGSPLRTVPKEVSHFLFEGRSLISATGADRPEDEPSGDDWSSVVDELSPRFPLLEAARDDHALPGPGAFVSSTGSELLAVSHEGQRTRLQVFRLGPDRVRAGKYSSGTSTTDLMDRLQFPAWIVASGGSVVWANPEYRAMERRSARIAGRDGPVFATGSGQFEGSRRLRASGGSDQEAWFDIRSSPCTGGTFFTAINVDAAVRAERQLVDFTQTLTKTFAHLATGLAVFDRSRRLVLFNPALTDLTSLPVDFLTSRPTLAGFLDSLRDRRIIPEPKDYAAWRTQLAELEAGSLAGSYIQTWSMPGGQTYRLTGRPHAEGSIILLLEDISAEVSLTRRFSSQIETGQDVLDTLDDAIAVFSASGTLVMVNSAYERLWGPGALSGTRDVSVAEVTRTWLEQSAPTPVWGDFRDFVRDLHDRSEWAAEVRLRDGRGLTCRFLPVRNGTTLACFRLSETAGASEVRTARATA